MSAYCEVCDRSFGSEAALFQHRRDSRAHKRLSKSSSTSPDTNLPDSESKQDGFGLSLCDWCSKIFVGDPERFRGDTWKSRTLEEIKSGVPVKCFICSIVWNLANEVAHSCPSEVEYSVSESIDKGSEDYVEKTSTFHICFIQKYNVKLGDAEHAFFTGFSSKSYPWSLPLPDDTSSLQSLNMAKLWVESCASNHAECLKHQTPGWHPTRLLEVDFETKGLWRLRLSAEDKFVATRYMTLSYRWGDHPFLKLTSRVLDEFRSGQPIASLPKTFQDAIIVAKYFGIRYLWIDALCIIQDSVEDWENESKDMCQVYSNSYCNLMASDSNDPFGGLFRKPDQNNFRISSITPKWKRPGRTNHALSSIDSLVVDDIIYEDITSSVLSKRGWIIQERVLPPRVLYFTKRQLEFECNMGIKCELTPNGVPKILSYGRNGMPGYDPSHQWSSLVANYSGCALTKSSDKLIAIAGLADRYAKLLDDTYVFGLWLAELPWELNWQTYDGRRSTQSRAPSWAWSSIDGQVYTHTKNLTKGASYHVKVVNAEMTAHGGCLFLKAPSIVVDLRDRQVRPWFVKGSKEECNASLRSDTAGEDLVVEGASYRLLLVLSEMKGAHPELSGLVLQAAPNMPDAYVRVGTFSHDKMWHNPDNIEVSKQFAMWGKLEQDGSSYTFEARQPTAIKIV